MTTQKLPGSDAARHGSGDADLTIMIAAHDAFRRDLVSLARAASFADLGNPAKRQSVSNGWEVFKRQLHAHHTGEDTLLWPKLAGRFAQSESARSVLAAMEEEHARIDPLLAAVDQAFAGPGSDGLGDTVGELATALQGHLAHEERDALPLIGAALTAAEWRAVGRQLGRANGLSVGAEFFAWMLDNAPPERAAAVLGELPPPLRLVYRAALKPRYSKVSRW